MASFFHFLLQLILISLLPTALSQSPSDATLANCGPRLLPLAPCAPFVQGSAQSPVQPCCDNLRLLYSQVPSCLCLLLNSSTMSPFPINTTLALELPSLCNLQADTSSCPVPPSSAGSQVSLGTNTTPTAASPEVTLAPRPSIVGFGMGSSGVVKLQTESAFAVLVACVLFLLV
ncbi:Bifunctional inhibitor/plant lipid transfer protein/seed storage helical domain [Dillenia turbinata]|uniref:Bifunctional inhibitor/plant lipid transfer protein/seed storage helical domain n=1 Tax=Dillenia turbinata TaxID=194707 RepID=A0AAN8VD57_9MAGN